MISHENPEFSDNCKIRVPVHDFNIRSFPRSEFCPEKGQGN